MAFFQIPSNDFDKLVERYKTELLRCRAATSGGGQPGEPPPEQVPVPAQPEQPPPEINEPEQPRCPREEFAEPEPPAAPGEEPEEEGLPNPLWGDEDPFTSYEPAPGHDPGPFDSNNPDFGPEEPAAPPPQEEPSPGPEPPGPVPVDLPPMGTLRVSATAGRGAAPVPGALVLVSRMGPSGREVLYAAGETGPDGWTRAFRLPSVPASLSQSPEGAQKPFIGYHVRIDKPGYSLFDACDVPVYENIAAIQKANLVPLPESERDGRAVGAGPGDY